MTRDFELNKQELRDLRKYNKNFSLSEEKADGKEIVSLIVISHGNKNLHDSGFPFIKIIGCGVDNKYYKLGWHDHFVSYVPINVDSFGKNIFHIHKWSSSKKTKWVVRGECWTSSFMIGRGFGRDEHFVELS